MELYLHVPIWFHCMHTVSFIFFIIQEQVILNHYARGQQLSFIKKWHRIVFE
jgi:hypothetical protein